MQKTTAIRRSFLIALFVFSCGPSPSWGAGGDVVNNGGGLSENNILYAFLNLRSMVESCMYSKGCGLTLPEQELLLKIYQNHRYELNGAGIRFLSSKEHPDVFDLDESGAPRTAVTGDDVGSPIYFNIERLYPVVNGQIQFIDVLTATGFLVHELGHHHGVKNHTYLDRLGGKVRDFIGSQRWLSINLRKFRNNQLTVSTFFPLPLFGRSVVPIIDTQLQVSISNGYEIFDLSPLFAESSRCAGRKDTFVDSSGSDLNWVPLPAFNSVTNTQDIRFQIVVNWSCNPWPNPGERLQFSQTLEVSNQFKVMTLGRIDLFTWKLSEPNFNPASWRSEESIVLSPQGPWQVQEVRCENIDYNLNPIGPCDP